MPNVPSRSRPKHRTKRPKSTDPLLACVLRQEALRKLGAKLVLGDEFPGCWVDAGTDKSPTIRTRSIAFRPLSEHSVWEPVVYFQDGVDPKGLIHGCDYRPWAELEAEFKQIRALWPEKAVVSLMDAAARVALYGEHLRAFARREDGENFADFDIEESMLYTKGGADEIRSFGFDPDAVACSYLEAIAECEESQRYRELHTDDTGQAAA